MPPKRPETVELEDNAFAHAYVESGFNGKQAMLSIRPDLTPGSAMTRASAKLSTEQVRDRIEAITCETRDVIFGCMARAAKRLEEIEILHPDPKIRTEFFKILMQYGQVFAPHSPTPGKVTQINKYALPKK